jgi:formylglycine-generating enzyme
MMLLTLACFEGISSDVHYGTTDEDMVSIEATSYEMGYPDGPATGPNGNGLSSHWKETAQPQHTVSLSSFEIDRTEVTVGQYAQFLTDLYAHHPQATPPHHHHLQPLNFNNDVFQPISGYEQRPINYVSWYNAATYCDFYGKRLPTEAEWELVVKGDSTEDPRTYPWSRPDLQSGGANCQRAVYFTHRTLCEPDPNDVGSRSPEGDTPEGIADIAGNVSEWVYDWFDYYPEEEVTNPKGPATGTYKILRGGGFRDTPDALRATDRVIARPYSRSEGVGFRCARGSQ